MIEAARQNARLLVLPILLATAVLAAIGLLREPTHTAESKLIVGKVDARIGGVSGFLRTTRGLGNGYTRYVYAEGVLRAASSRTGLSRDEIRDRASVTVDRDAPVLKVKAEGDSAGQAKLLATVLSEAMVREINRLNKPEPDAEGALAAFRAASAEYEALAGRAQVLERRLSLQAQPTTGARLELARVKADLQATRLRINAMEGAYDLALSDAPVDLVRMLARAEGTTTDRGRILAFLVYVGLVTGALVGLVLIRIRTRDPREPGPALAGGMAWP